MTATFQKIRIVFARVLGVDDPVTIFSRSSRVVARKYAGRTKLGLEGKIQPGQGLTQCLLVGGIIAPVVEKHPRRFGSELEYETSVFPYLQ